MLTKLYRKYISQKTRDKIYEYFLGDILFVKRNFAEVVEKKFYWLFRLFLPDTEKNRRYAFMGKHGLTHLPYPFLLEYKKKMLDCQFDKKLEMFFVNHNGKKLFFPKAKSRREVIEEYRRLIAERDHRSPHQYVKDINRLQGKTLLDVGAAEAMFSLDVIELVTKVYLFECEQEWIEPLKATFEPWKNKVEIVQKYVSDTNDENNITIDKFLEGKDKSNLFIKMDIEGYEQAALRGAKHTFSEAQEIDFSITTYHREDDVEKISAFLQQHNLEYEQTEGFFYWWTKGGDKGLRRAIIRRKLIYDDIIQ